MTISNFYRGNTRQFRFQFLKPNPAYTGRPPVVVVTSAGDGEFDEISAQVIITSLGVIDDVWTITFDNDTEYTCVGATEGNVGQGNTGQNFLPYNTDKRAEYFSLPFAGFSGTFANGDTIVFTTVRVNIPVDITNYELTLTFLEEGATTPTVQIDTTAGSHILDDIPNGIMYLELISGDSADLVKEEYEYGFERRIPFDPPDVDKDDVRTLETGTVKILTPKKAITP